MLKSIIWLILGGIVASESDLYVDPPSIRIKENVEKESESRYTLTVRSGQSSSMSCVSGNPITWKPFKNFTGIYGVEHTEIAENEYRFESTIHVIDITHFYVGYFFCVENRTLWDYDYSLTIAAEKMLNLKEMDGFSMVYLYVEEDTNLLVQTDAQDMVILNNEYLVIPCKPTNKNIGVKLLEDENEILQHDFASEHHQLFDPTVGFAIKFFDYGEIYGRTFKCSPKSYSNPGEIIFEVKYRELTIQSARGLYVTKGEQLILNCRMEFLENEPMHCNWTIPEKKSHIILSKIKHTRSNLLTKVCTIQITNTEYGGNFKCQMENKSLDKRRGQIFIQVLEKGHSIDISLSGSNTIEIDSSIRSAVWRVEYRGYPIPSFELFDNHNRPITSSNTESGKYEVKTYDDHIILKIKFLRLEDSGNYTLKARNALRSTEKILELRVRVRPSVAVMANVAVHEVGDFAEFVCECQGYPLSTITWTFTLCKPMPVWPSCIGTQTIEDKYIRTTLGSDFEQTSVLKYTATETGKVECIASNIKGKHNSSAFLRVMGNETPFRVYVLPDNTEIFAGDNVTLVCEASAYRYSSLNWLLRSRDINVQSWHTNETFRKNITWNGIEIKNAGPYKCRAPTVSIMSLGPIPPQDTVYEQELNITVHEPKKPEINGPIAYEMEVMLGSYFQLHCNISGAPSPQIKWYKNKVPLKQNHPKIQFSDGMQTLEMNNSTKEENCTFKCFGENRFGFAEKLIHLRIIEISSRNLTSLGITKGNKITNQALIVGASAVALTLAFIICTAYLLVRLRRERRLRCELYAVVLEKFEDGNLSGLNPDLALHEQADLLPYNKKYEFPRQNLYLGKQLGAGAFGVVMKGLAIGILPYEEKTTVAVKMVKKTADNEQIRALVSELKILVHLGKHLNVVNLLGAVTKNIAQRELMVIVEYCRFGNVQNFLIKHRKLFIDQRNTETDSIDSKIRRCSYDSGYENSRRSESAPIPFNSRGRMDSANTDTTLINSTSRPSTSGDEGVVLSNNSLQPVDYTSPMRCISTTDLVCWLFQVARGMAYLASRKVLHGDLAARNILLCDDNVVKICDFGLARSMYKSCNYIKKGETPLPLKWLAIESISAGVFSTFSDIWSFGVVMWELFSLGMTPYPGIDAYHDLFVKLKDGYRMDKPEQATQEIYDIMLHCWNVNPESRPLFTTLEERLRKLLETETIEHYVDLNEQYVQMNPSTFVQGQTDYLSFMGPPEGIAPLIFDYEKGQVSRMFTSDITQLIT